MQSLFPWLVSQEVYIYLENKGVAFGQEESKGIFDCRPTNGDVF